MCWTKTFLKDYSLVKFRLWYVVGSTFTSNFVQSNIFHFTLKFFLPSFSHFLSFPLSSYICLSFLSLHPLFAFSLFIKLSLLLLRNQTLLTSARPFFFFGVCWAFFEFVLDFISCFWICVRHLFFLCVWVLLYLFLCAYILDFISFLYLC